MHPNGDKWQADMLSPRHSITLEEKTAVIPPSPRVKCPLNQKKEEPTQVPHVFTALANSL